VEAGRSRRIARLRGSLDTAPVEGRAFLGGALLLSGLPPSALFASEVAILFGGFAVGWGIAAGVATVLLALAVAGFLFHIGRVSFGVPRRWSGIPAVAGTGRRVTLVVPLAVVAVLGLWTPEPVATAIARVVAVLGGGGG
jgi:hydrogenase-4 component F